MTQLSGKKIFFEKFQGVPENNGNLRLILISPRTYEASGKFALSQLLNSCCVMVCIMHFLFLLSLSMMHIGIHIGYTFEFAYIYCKYSMF